MSVPVSIAIDRSITVRPGQFVYTAYVDVFSCRLACRERMAVGDVDRAYQKQLQLGSAQAWPPPTGYWDADENVFVIQDGRHQWVAAVMLGLTHLLVAWVSNQVRTEAQPCTHTSDWHKEGKPCFVCGDDNSPIAQDRRGLRDEDM